MDFELGLAATSKRLMRALPLLVFFAVVEAEIRCYCNQPACVSTGYMCKSPSDSCFTERSGEGVERLGCRELLPRHKRRCPVGSALRCCHEDMCNYVDSLDLNIQVHSPLSGPFGSEAERQAFEAALRRDVWFKAAVIAVPIAGGFILILLVVAAARMLSQDNRRQRRFLQLRRQTTLCRHAHLYRNVEASCCLHHPTMDSLKDTLLPWTGDKSTTVL